MIYSTPVTSLDQKFICGQSLAPPLTMMKRSPLNSTSSMYPSCVSKPRSSTSGCLMTTSYHGDEGQSLFLSSTASLSGDVDMCSQMHFNQQMGPNMTTSLYSYAGHNQPINIPGATPSGLTRSHSDYTAFQQPKYRARPMLETSASQQAIYEQPIRPTPIYPNSRGSSSQCYLNNTLQNSSVSHRLNNAGTGASSQQTLMNSELEMQMQGQLLSIGNQLTYAPASSNFVNCLTTLKRPQSLSMMMTPTSTTQYSHLHTHYHPHHGGFTGGATATTAAMRMNSLDNGYHMIMSNQNNDSITPRWPQTDPSTFKPLNTFQSPPTKSQSIHAIIPFSPKDMTHPQYLSVGGPLNHNRHSTSSLGGPSGKMQQTMLTLPQQSRGTLSRNSSFHQEKTPIPIENAVNNPPKNRSSPLRLRTRSNEPKSKVGGTADVQRTSEGRRSLSMFRSNRQGKSNQQGQRLSTSTMSQMTSQSYPTPNNHEKKQKEANSHKKTAGSSLEKSDKKGPASLMMPFLRKIPLLFKKKTPSSESTNKHSVLATSSLGISVESSPRLEASISSESHEFSQDIRNHNITCSKDGAAKHSSQKSMPDRNVRSKENSMFDSRYQQGRNPSFSKKVGATPSVLPHSISQYGSTVMPHHYLSNFEQSFQVLQDRQRWWAQMHQRQPQVRQTSLPNVLNFDNNLNKISTEKVEHWLIKTAAQQQSQPYQHLMDSVIQSQTYQTIPTSIEGVTNASCPDVGTMSSTTSGSNTSVNLNHRMLRQRRPDLMLESVEESPHSGMSPAPHAPSGQSNFLSAIESKQPFSIPMTTAALVSTAKPSAIIPHTVLRADLSTKKTESDFSRNSLRKEIVRTFTSNSHINESQTLVTSSSGYLHLNTEPPKAPLHMQSNDVLSQVKIQDARSCIPSSAANEESFPSPLMIRCMDGSVVRLAMDGTNVTQPRANIHSQSNSATSMSRSSAPFRHSVPLQHLQSQVQSCDGVTEETLPVFNPPSSIKTAESKDSAIGLNTAPSIVTSASSETSSSGIPHPLKCVESSPTSLMDPDPVETDLPSLPFIYSPNAVFGNDFQSSASFSKYPAPAPPRRSDSLRQSVQQRQSHYQTSMSLPSSSTTSQQPIETDIENSAPGSSHQVMKPIVADYTSWLQSLPYKPQFSNLPKPKPLVRRLRDIEQRQLSNSSSIQETDEVNTAAHLNPTRGNQMETDDEVFATLVPANGGIPHRETGTNCSHYDFLNSNRMSCSWPAPPSSCGLNEELAPAVNKIASVGDVTSDEPLYATVIPRVQQTSENRENYSVPFSGPKNLSRKHPHLDPSYQSTTTQLQPCPPPYSALMAASVSMTNFRESATSQQQQSQKPLPHEMKHILV